MVRVKIHFPYVGTSFTNFEGQGDHEWTITPLRKYKKFVLNEKIFSSSGI